MVDASGRRDDKLIQLPIKLKGLLRIRVKGKGSYWCEEEEDWKAYSKCFFPILREKK